MSQKTLLSSYKTSSSLNQRHHRTWERKPSPPSNSPFPYVHFLPKYTNYLCLSPCASGCKQLWRRAAEKPAHVYFLLSLTPSPLLRHSFHSVRSDPPRPTPVTEKGGQEDQEDQGQDYLPRGPRRESPGQGRGQAWPVERKPRVRHSLRSQGCDRGDPGQRRTACVGQRRCR